MDTQEVLIKKLDHWKRRLIDLSKRNNLISYRFTKSKSLKIDTPDFMQALSDLEQEGNIRFLKEAIEDTTKTGWLCTEDEETVSKKLYTLYLRARENFQERGISTCFVSLGMFCYKDSSDSEISRSAPIFLYPVEITRTNPSKNFHKFQITSDGGEPQLSPALVELLAHDYGIELKEFSPEDFAGYMDYIEKTLNSIKDGHTQKEVHVDIFSYQKYIMYDDLIKNEQYVKSSDLVKGYIGDRDALQDEISELEREDFNDATGPDVLPADSSQKRAVELAKAGVTFVLQGPPGTGKSQTVVNIIASLIQQKKRVLFVSQKMAALNVVQKRLDQVGLGRYCLNLHKYKGNKKEIIRQLMHELETSPSISDETRRFMFDSYLNTQTELNEFYDFLGHKREPWGLSIYELRGKIAKLHNVDDSQIGLAFSEILSLPPEKIAIQADKLNRIQGILRVVKNPYDAWLYYFKKSMNTTLARRDFDKLVDSFKSTVESVSIYADRVRNETKVEVDGVGALDHMAEIEKILAKTDNIQDFLVSDKFFEYSKSLKSLHTMLTSMSQLKAEILGRTKEDFLQDDLKEQERVYTSSGIIPRLFSAEYRNSKRILTEYAKGKVSHKDWLLLSHKKKQLIDLTDKSDKTIAQQDFNDLIEDPKDIGTIGKLSKLCSGLEPAFTHARDIAEKGFSELIRFGLGKNSQVNMHLEEAGKQVDDIQGFMDKDVVKFEGNIGDIVTKVHEMHDLLPHLNEILFFKEELLALQEEIRNFVLKYLEAGVQDSLVGVFYKSYYLQILDTILKKENKLSPKDLVEIFRSEDYAIRDHWRKKIMLTVQEEKPSFSFQSTGVNEVQILKRENQKKRRLKPIRQLLQEIPTLAFKLKPCFMMSPLTVSQYIDPSNLQFDAVVFDEASQIMPEDAVPCLMRAKQAIVMGDTQQLPPTSFFTTQDDDDIEEEIEDLESFLSESSVKFREKYLQWHYRSNSEELIAFSNRFFYDNRLVTFPNYRSENENALSFVYVKDGVYDRGKSRKNQAEARKAVEVYQALKREHKDKSFGIIAFSIAQEKAIREAFLQKGIQLEENIDPHIEELFIKNLETVQGDERDVIILCVGYGKDSQGRLSYNFGPLNKSNGYKRLNVAITRSRDLTVVVSSIHPTDLDDGRINADGLRHLKNYMDFAVNKDFDKLITSTEHLAFDSSFEEAVYDALTAEGFDVSCQIGCSGYRIDLAIKHQKRKGEYVLGIECDGAQYHSSRYARDRDKVRQSVLERLGWNIHRIWSEDWLRNRAYEIDRIKKKVDALLKSGGSSQPVDKVTFEKIDDVDTLEEVSLDQQYEAYQIAYLPSATSYLEFDGHGSLVGGLDDVFALLMETIKIESPIEKELLFKRVLASFGIVKLGQRIRRNFEGILEHMKNQNLIHIYGDTVSDEAIDGVVPVRVSTEAQRPFVCIPNEELGGAVVDILKNTFSIERSALISDVARGIYGNNRTGTRIQSKMSETISYLKAKGIIVEENETVRLMV
ncbi:DUF3320 domain-containing protein [Candidatus Poribacteria bacterium]